MDRMKEMAAFTTVVVRGGFSEAAREMGISKSVVSKHVSSLEARLGARLLDRTTRRVSPTEIGLRYYERASQVLNEVGAAEAMVSSMQAKPAGVLRVSVDTDFGATRLSPVLAGFSNEFPDVLVNMELSYRHRELISEKFDLAVRLGVLENSTFQTRKLATTHIRLIASPSYLQQYGRPQRIDDLKDHKLLHYSTQASSVGWTLTSPSGETRQVRGLNWFTVNDGQSLLNACVQGLGIARLPAYLYASALREGLVETVLPTLPVETETIYAEYPSGRSIQPNVRAFIDYLSETFSENEFDNW